MLKVSCASTTPLASEQKEKVTSKPHKYPHRDLSKYTLFFPFSFKKMHIKNMHIKNFNNMRKISKQGQERSKNSLSENKKTKITNKIPVNKNFLPSCF